MGQHSGMGNITGDITSHMCYAINKIVPGQALGAQNIRGFLHRQEHPFSCPPLR